MHSCGQVLHASCLTYLLPRPMAHLIESDGGFDGHQTLLVLIQLTAKVLTCRTRARMRMMYALEYSSSACQHLHPFLATCLSRILYHGSIFYFLSRSRARSLYCLLLFGISLGQLRYKVRYGSCWRGRYLGQSRKRPWPCTGPMFPRLRCPLARP